MACVEISVGQEVPIGIAFDVDPEPIHGIADQCRAIWCRIIIQDARGDLVMVIDVAGSRVALAAVKHLVSARVATLSVQRIEEIDTVVQDPDGASGKAPGGRCKRRRHR
jgi:hypothetical protein